MVLWPYMRFYMKLREKNEVGVVLKLDFEKAYDKVNWNFMFECLSQWGFCATWCDWIRKVVIGGMSV